MAYARRLYAVFVLALVVAAQVFSQTEDNSSFALRDGDRVVFYGDSITAQRFYTRFAEDIVVSRYPHLRISFFNAGVSGDMVEGGHAGNMEERLNRDVLPLRPTVVTIMLGMNDGRYTTEYDSNFKAYAEGYRKLIASLRNALPGVRLILIRPSPYEEVAHPPAIAGYNAVMLRYGQFLSELGKQENIPVVDFNRPLTAAVQRGSHINGALAGSLLPDRIHPSPAGHWIMAASLAQGWNVDPVVSSAVIDAQRGNAGEQHNTAVSQVRVAPENLSWTQLDQALPLPLELNDPITQFLLQASDLAALDQQILRISGLTAGSYTLFIDGKKIARFSRDELNTGVNLALYQTPMEEQAKSIDWTADDRSKVSGTRFALFTSKQVDPSRQQAIEALDRLDRQMIDDEYKSAQPKPHYFELISAERQP